jgi:hypothetical protein
MDRGIIMNKSVLTISREWHNPQIKTTITNQAISLEMSIEDFEKALVAELGKIHVTMSMDKKIKKAIQAVIDGVKQESAKVV